MEKQPKWKIWPKEVFRTAVAVGICSVLLGAMLPVIVASLDNERLATWLHWAGIFFAVGGGIVLAMAVLCFTLERWQKNHPESEEGEI